MENKNSNQPAFGFVDNRSNSYEDNEVHYGLTKREYFAAMAMQGILAGGEITKKDDVYTVNGRNLDVTLIAKDAIGCADALLEQLNKT